VLLTDFSEDVAAVPAQMAGESERPFIHTSSSSATNARTEGGYSSARAIQVPTGAGDVLMGDEVQVAEGDVFVGCIFSTSSLN
jgi:hypothetical protein